MKNTPEVMDFLLKITLLGDSSVGKSSLLLKSIENTFHERYMCTMGVDFKVKHLMISNKKVKLQIWDTAGQEKFRQLAKCYYRNSNGSVIVFDVSNRETFASVGTWIAEYSREIPNAVIVIVGNKIDKDRHREVLEEEGYELAKRFNSTYIETSAKTGENLGKVFQVISENIIAQIDETQCASRGSGVLLSVEQEKRSCCK